MNSLNSFFRMKLSDIQPSQLYISKEKLAKVKQKFNSKEISTLEVIPVKKIGKEFFYTDGHTRAFAAYQAGFTEIPVIWEDQKLEWKVYKICINWCKAAGVYTIADLRDRVINQKDYEILWYKRCDDLYKKLMIKRINKKISKNF